MTGLMWTRKTTETIATELRTDGISISPGTVGRILSQLGYRLRSNEKKITRAKPADRDAQFQKIAALRQTYAANGWPIISIDTKKKELVGLFKNGGKSWRLVPRAVLDHDFRSDADGIAVPYGIYLPGPNSGMVMVGRSHDTPEFAVDCVEAWWRLDGHEHYASADHLLVLADSGGSNGASPRAWKWFLKERLCNAHGLTVTVAHYPSGASKWNPIEHRLFSEISKNWAGRPLESWETLLNFIRTTSTKPGLRVRAELVTKTYSTGVKISNAQMRALGVVHDPVLPKWNYTIGPA